MTSAPKRRYVVSKGVYSDYTVMCVCPGKAVAERVAAAYNRDPESYNEARVESIPYVTEPVKVTSYVVMATIHDDGRVRSGWGMATDRPLDETPQERHEWSFDMLWPDRASSVGWRWVRAPMHNGTAGRLEVFGTDRERVLKVFSEKRAQLLADDVMRARRELKG